MSTTPTTATELPAELADIVDRARLHLAPADLDAGATMAARPYDPHPEGEELKARIADLRRYAGPALVGPIEDLARTVADDAANLRGRLATEYEFTRQAVGRRAAADELLFELTERATATGAALVRAARSRDQWEKAAMRGEAMVDELVELLTNDVRLNSDKALAEFVDYDGHVRGLTNRQVAATVRQAQARARKSAAEAAGE